MVPPVLVVNEVNGVLPPISADNVVVPVVFKVNEYPPFTVPPKLIALDVLPDNIVLAVITMGVPASPKLIVLFVVCMVPARLTWLGAEAVTPPVKVVASPEALPNVT